MIQPTLYSHLSPGTKCRMKGTDYIYEITHYSFDRNKWGPYERVHLKGIGGLAGFSDIVSEFDKHWEVLG